MVNKSIKTSLLYKPDGNILIFYYEKLLYQDGVLTTANSFLLSLTKLFLQGLYIYNFELLSVNKP